MFWCHGGGFTWESGSWPWVDGASLARRGDVVVVTVNHRLGLFGYLSLAELGGEKYAASGNAGMLDLVLALQWVRDNIERFGGDPGAVMLFGQSGGGAKVGTLMSMPAAKGLYHRAAIQSGAWVEAVKQDDASRIGRTFLSELNIGAADVDALQRVSVAKLLSVKAGDMHPSGTARGRLRMGMAPVLDGRFLPANPFDPSSPSFSADVPLLIGNTRHETTLFYLPDNEAFSLDEAGLVRRIREGFDESETKEIISIYRGLNPGISESEIFFLSTTDRLVRRDTIMTAERKHAVNRAPVFAYTFDWRSPALGGKLGATHTVEIPFVFDNTTVPTVMTASNKAAALAAVTSNAWIAFARTGSPQHAGLPAWPTYNPTTRATMVFNDETRLVNDPDGAARAFWASREP
jgi:para-nitrobenzyl esterase